MGRDMNDTEKKCVIITAGCFIDDETRRGTPISIPKGDVIQCIPLYPTILEDGNRLTTGMAILREICIGTCTSGVVNIFEGNEGTGLEHGIGVWSVWP